MFIILADCRAFLQSGTVCGCCIGPVKYLPDGWEIYLVKIRSNGEPIFCDCFAFTWQTNGQGKSTTESRDEPQSLSKIILISMYGSGAGSCGPIHKLACIHNCAALIFLKFFPPFHPVLSCLCFSSFGLHSLFNYTAGSLTLIWSFTVAVTSMWSLLPDSKSRTGFFWSTSQLKF